MTISGTSKGGGVDYLDSFGDLEFKNDETFKYISVKIIDDEDYEKHEHFFLEIGHPKKVAAVDSSGRAIYDEDFSLVRFYLQFINLKKQLVCKRKQVG